MTTHHLPLSGPRTRAWSSNDLLMLTAVLIWGINFTAVKLALREFTPLAFNGVRFSLATVAMSAILVWQARTHHDADLLRLPRYDWLRIILLGILGNTLYQLLFITGMNHTTPANSSLLMATAPIWVAVIGYLLRIERISPVMWSGILLSFAGMIVLILGGEGQLRLGASTLPGDAMLLGCAIVWALFTTLSKPFLGRYSPLKLTTWTMITGTAPLAVICLPAIMRQDWRTISAVGWGALLFSALLAVVVGYLVWYTSVQRVGNARTAIYSNVTPVFAIAIAWLLLGSTLTWLQGLGALVVLLGLALTRRGRVK